MVRRCFLVEDFVQLPPIVSWDAEKMPGSQVPPPVRVEYSVDMEGKSIVLGALGCGRL